MALATTHTFESEGTFFNQALHWTVRRFGLYVGAAVGCMALFAAGTAFYAYVWPAPQQQAQIQQLPIPVPHSVPPPVHKPEPPKAPGKEAEGAVVATVPVIAPSATVTTSSGTAPPPVAIVAPAAIGTPIVDADKLVIGAISGTETFRGQQMVVVTLTGTNGGEIKVPYDSVKWKGDAAKSTPSHGELDFTLAYVRNIQQRMQQALKREGTDGTIQVSIPAHSSPYIAPTQ